MLRSDQDQETVDDRTPEEVVVEHARRYDEARREAERLHRERILTGEEERLAECDAHAEANERLAVGRERDDRTMGFTGTAAAPSGEESPDPRTGRAYLHHQGLVVERKRLEALCDRADRYRDEAHGALLAATADLAPSTVEESDGEGPEEGFDLLPGGGEGAAPEAGDRERADDPLVGATSAA